MEGRVSNNLNHNVLIQFLAKNQIRQYQKRHGHINHTKDASEKGFFINIRQLVHTKHYTISTTLTRNTPCYLDSGYRGDLIVGYFIYQSTLDCLITH